MSLRDELQKSRIAQHLFTLPSCFDKLAISPSQASVHGKRRRSNEQLSYIDVEIVEIIEDHVISCLDVEFDNRIDCDAHVDRDEHV